MYGCTKCERLFEYEESKNEHEVICAGKPRKFRCAVCAKDYEEERQRNFHQERGVRELAILHFINLCNINWFKLYQFKISITMIFN